MIVTCSPIRAKELMESDPNLQVVDVREYAEYAGGHVGKARLISLGELEKRCGELAKDQPVILLCKGGKRAAQAAEKLHGQGFQNLTVVEGGTEAWIGAGLPVDKIGNAPWALERQVRLAAGLLVLAGLFIPPWPFVSAFVGAGLVFAALTNTCGMALMLSKMPWNRAGKCCAGGSCSRK